MFFKQFFLGCLAHASYMIGDKGEAVVVDPQRDVGIYLDEAKRQGLSIRHIIETHLHADFVSGHVELAQKTGAKIYMGKKAQAKFDHVPVVEGDEIVLGDVVLRFLETPGHTPESISVLVTDRAESAQPKMILTGDTLFIGDVGRPDLAGSKGYTPQTMAAMLYESLWNKILKLPDATLVYPAHGAGSSCGRNISAQAFSTLGEQKKTNFALKKMSQEAFVQMATSDLPDAPEYFSHDAEINRLGARSLADLPTLMGLCPREIQKKLATGSVLLDVRENRLFGEKHVVPSLNVGLSGWFASWCAKLIGPQKEIILVADSDEQIQEARLRLARVGMEHVGGYLQGGVTAWEKDGYPCGMIHQITPAQLEQMLQEKAEDLQVLDVRGDMEYQGGHIPQALQLELTQFEKKNQEISNWQLSKPLVVICGSGYRSSAATSLLEQKGFQELFNVLGGMKAWLAEGRKTVV